MKIRAVRAFVWEGRPVDIGDVLEVTPFQAHALCGPYRRCVPVEGEELPPAPGSAAASEIVTGDPHVQHNDPREPHARDPRGAA